MSGFELSLRPAGPVALAAAVGACVLLLPVPVLVRSFAAPALYFGVLVLLGSMPAELTQALRSRASGGMGDP
jgi:hypothetical protein